MADNPRFSRSDARLRVNGIFKSTRRQSIKAHLVPP
jgi:hypothetical protein